MPIVVMRSRRSIFQIEHSCSKSISPFKLPILQPNARRRMSNTKRYHDQTCQHHPVLYLDTFISGQMTPSTMNPCIPNKPTRIDILLADQTAPESIFVPPASLTESGAARRHARRHTYGSYYQCANAITTGKIRMLKWLKSGGYPDGGVVRSR